MRLSTSRRAGKVVVLVAISLTTLFGVVALALDGGVLQDDRQRAQSTADAAALAAADVLYMKWPQYQGADYDGTAAQAARNLAQQNGFPNPDVHIPPTSGPFTGKAGYAEVTVNWDQRRYFSKVFGSSDIHVAARAVAVGRWSPYNAGILVLDPSAPGALTDTGGGSVTVTNVPLIVNSSAPDAATATGGGVVSAPDFQITGVPGTSGSGSFVGPIHNGVPPTPDPLAYLPEPNPAGMPVQTKNNNGYHLSSAKTDTISPGVYRGGITVTGQGSLNMLPGIYYMDGGGFSFSGQGSLNAQGVMIVNAPQSSSDRININGTGSINISPMTSGIYAGISLWQVRSSTNTLYVSGNGGSSMTGTFYTANGTLNVTGNGTNNVIGSQYISRLLTVNGNGAFTVNWTPQTVAHMRLLNLAE